MNLWVEKMIKRHEGYRGDIYKDTTGHPTGGFGHCFEIGSKLPREIWEQIFQYDLQQAEKIVAQIGIPDDVLGEVRKGVLLDMAFNLGDNLFEFTRTLADIRRGDFASAARRMEKSLWAKQVGKRAQELIEMMETGILPEERK